MKKIFNNTFIKFFFIGAMSLMNQKVNAKDIIVHIENIDTNRSGNIMVLLFGNDGFPKDHAKAVALEVMPANIDKLTIQFSSAPAEFAIKVLHDEDETGQVTKNWTGIFPSEGLGFSNGARLSFGPPSFNDAKLTLVEMTSAIKIQIIYP